MRSFLLSQLLLFCSLSPISLAQSPSNIVSSGPATADVATKDNSALAEAVESIIEQPKFKHAHWGILATDLATGEVLFERQPDQLFVPASTTKLFTVAAAWDTLGPDHRFATKVFSTEPVEGGTLRGDLVLVAGGDLMLGGRIGKDGKLEFANVDHTYANGFNATKWIDADPLAGLKQLAAQVATNIQEIKGDVIVDDRLFAPHESSGSGPELVTPIMVNDNIVDFLIEPTTNGAPAKCTFRPQSDLIQVEFVVTTGASDSPSRIEVTGHGANKFTVRGTIPENGKPVLRNHEFDEPANLARGLFIEALLAKGVRVSKSKFAANDREKLSGIVSFDDSKKVAQLDSLPFSEEAKLILKVSHNLHANALPDLIALHAGKKRFIDGLRIEKEFLSRVGVEPETISFADGAGGARADYVTPRAAVSLLRYMATRPDFARFEDTLPVMGIDGTLATTVESESVAKGVVKAKTGTLLWENELNGGFILTSKALAGYLTAKSGRKVAFALYVNNVHLKKSSETSQVGSDLGAITEVFVEKF